MIQPVETSSNNTFPFIASLTVNLLGNVSKLNFIMSFVVVQAQFCNFCKKNH